MPTHHIIPRHEWKTRFGNLAGVNAPDNLVELTTEQHSQVHGFCYELNGNQYDCLAALRIAGAIGHEEAIRGAQIHSNKTRIITESHRKNQSLKMKGRKHTLEHNQKIAASCVGLHRGSMNPMYGRKHTPEAMQKQKERRIENANSYSK